MKAELQLDISAVVEEVTQRILKELKPLLDQRATTENTIYSVQALADKLGVSPQWVYERIQLKEIPYFKLGKFPRFKQSDIDRWLEDQKVPVAQPLSKKLKLVK